MPQIELNYLVDTKEHKYVGRFLGFLKDDEFNAICQSKTAVGKIESKETKPLVEVCQKYDSLVGHRLIMAIRKVDGENIIGKKLFISERLNFISMVEPDKKRAVFVSENETNLVVQEIE